MKIVYIINQLRKSGPVNVLYNIIANIDRAKFTPIIIKLMQDDVDRSLTYKFKELGVEIIEMNLSFWALELRTKRIAKNIDNLLSYRCVDIVNTHGYHPLLISSYLKYKVCRIDTLHCMSIDSFRNSRGWLIGTYMHFRYMLSLNKIDMRVGISSAVTHYYDTILKNKKSITIYNGINMSKFGNHTAHTKVKLKEKLGLSKYSVIFVVVGHLSRLKDPITVINAYKRLIDSQELSNSCLLFCGTGVLEARCKKLAKGYPMIKFLGYIDNVHEYLQIANYSICASHSEGFGLNFIESLASGCAVISTRIPAFNEFVAYYPELENLQFTPSNAIELANVIRFTTTTQIDVDTIRRDVEQRFSSRTMSNNYVQLFCQITKLYESSNNNTSASL